MAGYKVLVVEDDAPVMNLLVNVLESEKYEVVQARNGKEALAKLDTFQPDVILSDIMMPVMNGFELLKQLQSDKKTRHIPFLFLSAKKDIKDKVEGLSIGADDYICKPFALDELLIRIKTRLQKKETLLASQPQTQGAMVGDLIVFPVVDLIQILRLEKKTGEITLSYAKLNAFIKINKGDVVDVEYDQLSGLQAFRSILDHDEGWFSFRLSSDLFPVRLSISTQELLVESTRQLDEFKNLLSQLPPLDLIYRISDKQSSTVLSVKEMKVLYLFDGEHNLGEVFQRSSFEQSKTVTIIRYLLDNGFLEEKDFEQELVADEPLFVLTSLEEEVNRLFRSLLIARQGIPCILVISLDDIAVEPFIFRLCGPQDKNLDDCSFIKKDKIDFQKVFLNGEHELNIYSLKGFRQFSFLWHVLNRDILGLVLMIDNVETLNQSPIKDFLESLGSDYNVPYITVLGQTDATQADEEDPLLDKEILYHNVQSCYFGSGRSVMKIFTHWLETVIKHNAAKSDDQIE